MELILLTSVLTFANILGTQAVTQTLPSVDERGVTPRSWDEPRDMAENESEPSDSLMGAVIKFKKEKGWI